MNDKAWGRLQRQIEMADYVLAQITNTADAVLSSPPADASTLSGSAVSEMEMTELRQKVRRLEEFVRSAYREGFSTGEDSTIGEPDGYWERSEARAVLADMEQKP